MLTESVDKEAYVATLMHAAEHGAVELQTGRRGWTITDKARARRLGAGWTRSPAASPTCCPAPGSSFVAARKDVKAGKRLKTEVAVVRDRTPRRGRVSRAS